ncbi:hypothetical protein AURDEDRAFT_129238 [Auricularia subglabra TFB-10046 SS5]|nr:hypothetical protein AURDEDRAFT_129238 [Auricularia subglabra TFB-10046 SS5]
MYAKGTLYSLDRLSVEPARVLTNGTFAAVEEVIGRSARNYESHVRVKHRREDHKFAIFYTRRPSKAQNPHVWEVARHKWHGDILVLALGRNGKYVDIADEHLARRALKSCSPAGLCTKMHRMISLPMAIVGVNPEVP